MVLNFLAGGAAINVMARKAGAGLLIVDAGVATPLPDHPDLRVVGAGSGTADITQGTCHDKGAGRVERECAGVELALEVAEIAL